MAARKSTTRSGFKQASGLDGSFSGLYAAYRHYEVYRVCGLSGICMDGSLNFSLQVFVTFVGNRWSISLRV